MTIKIIIIIITITVTTVEIYFLEVLQAPEIEMSQDFFQKSQQLEILLTPILKDTTFNKDLIK